jgi:hypothetical protein
MIGEDLIIGEKSFYKLSKNITSTIHIIGTNVLAQERTLTYEDPSLLRWKIAEFLGLDGEQKEEWDYYVKGLVWTGIELNDEKDYLLWSWNIKGGQVNAK